MPPSRDIHHLLEIMARLRNRENGCPWDIVQTFQSIAPHTLEEAHEVVDAIARKDLLDLKEELGDLLLQVVFHAQMAHEEDAFDFGDVVEGITKKLIRRHPHIFGEATANTPEAVKVAWDHIKMEEKREKVRARQDAGLPPLPLSDSKSLLADVPAHLPAMQRAERLTRKAATVGFDWPNATDVIAKIREELAECEEALALGSPDTIEDEIGDVLFAVMNLARHAKINPELALARTNHKFMTRFAFIEDALSAQGRSLDEATLEEMEALWQKAKSEQ
jgi:nucleoside triphosphate diphosphatase